MHAALRLHAGTERGSGGLELLVCDQALDEHFAQGVSIEACELVIVAVVVLNRTRSFIGNERGGLDVEERRRHEQEVACNVEVERFEALHFLEVLLGHLGDGYSPDVDLLAGNKLEQQIERP